MLRIPQPSPTSGSEIKTSMYSSSDSINLVLLARSRTTNLKKLNLAAGSPIKWLAGTEMMVRIFRFQSEIAMLPVGEVMPDFMQQ